MTTFTQPPVALEHHAPPPHDVPRTALTTETGRPLFRVGHGILRQFRVVQVRKDREIDHSKRFVAASRRLPVDEVLSDAGVITMLPALNPT
jgi:hypothetical protein